MKKCLKITSASILVLNIVSPAFGKEPYPGFERDMALAFENDGELMELALLSEKEMAETKGAIWLMFALTTWSGRFFWGGTWGSILNAFDLNDGGFREVRTFYHWSAMQTMMYAVIGAASANGFIATALQLGMHPTRERLRQVMYENNWTIFDAFNHANSAISDAIADQLRGGTSPETPSEAPNAPDASKIIEGTSAQPMLLSSRSSDVGSDLLGLLAAFDQNELRQFFSDIPRDSFDEVLARVASDATRDDFLERLSTETVNNFLLLMPEEYMPAFTSIVPSHIMQGINRAMTPQPQARHMSLAVYALAETTNRHAPACCFHY